jgi:hypothetical protein
MNIRSDGQGDGNNSLSTIVIVVYIFSVLSDMRTGVSKGYNSRLNSSDDAISRNAFYVVLLPPLLHPVEVVGSKIMIIT